MKTNTNINNTLNLHTLPLWLRLPLLRSLICRAFVNEKCYMIK